MKTTTNILMTAGLAAALFVTGAADEPDRTAPVAGAEAPRKAVDLAICLDTSGSMSGLINAARQKLWAIVNDLALAQPTPTLRVALLTFGTPSYGAESGFVKLRTSLTDDLDKVSEELFALTTDGGDEYVGRVVHTALKELPWSPSKDSLKIIIVAGNESADQDQEFNFRDACKRAITNDIVINSIYCGNAADDEAPLWREVALLADGRFATIDQENGLVVIETPFDEQLAALSGSVNATYLPFGKEGAKGAQNQVAQDANAQSLNFAAAASRAQTKAGSLYVCGWDLVDALKQNQLELDKVPDEELPERLRGLSLEAKRLAIEAAGTERGELQQQISQISEQRQKYIQEQMKKQATSEETAFDHAIRGAIREQAKSKGFGFKNQ